MTKRMKDALLPIALVTLVLGAAPMAAARQEQTVQEQEQKAQEKATPSHEPAAQEAFERGLRLYRNRNFREALGELENVAQMEPGRADAHYLIGYCHLMLKEFQQSLDAFRLSFEQDPSFDPRTIYQARKQ